MTKYLKFFLLAISINSYSQDEPALVFNTFLIPLMVESETKGVFVDLTRQLAQRAGLKIEINILPTKRSINEFSLGHADALFPALDPFFIKNGAFNRTEELIYVKRNLAFTLKQNSLVKSMTQLEDNKVSITRGYPYSSQLINNTEIQFFTANSDIFSAKMLHAGHVDAFIAEEKSGLAAFRKLGIEREIQYSSQDPISELDVFYATLDTAQGLELAKTLSKHLTLMKQDGSFERIMAKANQ